MDEHIFISRMHSIQDDILRLNNAAFAMEAANHQHYPDNFLEFSLDTAIRAEKIACKLRHMIGDFGAVKKEPLMEKIAEAHGIEITDENGMIAVSVPRLLPKRKKPRSGEFITQPLYAALSRYCETHEIHKFQECAVCFVHVYDQALSLGRIRDYDNLEMAGILNTISVFCLTDDSGLLCDAYHTTGYGDRDCTRIFIMPQDRLPRFISELKNRPEMISNFGP